MFKTIMKLLFGRKSLAQKERIAELHSQYWDREKTVWEKELKIKQEKKEMKKRLSDIKFNFGKVFAFGLFVNFTAIEIFTAWATIQSFTLAYAIGMMPDFTPLVTLIGAVIGQTISYGIYANKAKAENTRGGITYDIAMQQFEQNNFNDDQAVG